MGTLRDCLQAVAPAIGLDPRRLKVGSVVAVPRSVLRFGSDRHGGRVPRVALVLAIADKYAVLVPGTTHADRYIPDMRLTPGDGSGVRQETWIRSQCAESVPKTTAAILHVIGQAPYDVTAGVCLRIFGRQGG